MFADRPNPDRRSAPLGGLSDVMDRFGAVANFQRDAEIYAQGEPVIHLFRVVKGVVRTARFTAEGRRHVGEFYYPGDLFGLESGPDHDFTAEALTDCEIRVVKRNAVRAAIGDGELDLAILGALHIELQRARAHMLLMGLRGAKEKVGGFLLALASHSPAASVELPMGRQDMADYLGLTIETVSRMLTQLQSEDIVEFPSVRRFKVNRPELLESIAA